MVIQFLPVALSRLCTPLHIDLVYFAPVPGSLLRKDQLLKGALNSILLEPSSFEKQLENGPDLSFYR